MDENEWIERKSKGGMERKKIESKRLKWGKKLIGRKRNEDKIVGIEKERRRKRKEEINVEEGKFEMIVRRRKERKEMDEEEVEIEELIESRKSVRRRKELWRKGKERRKKRKKKCIFNC